MINDILQQLSDNRAVSECIEQQLTEKIAEVAEVLLSAIRNGGKLLICGNGGSAADAQHFAAEIVGRFGREREAWPAIALTTDTSVLTSIANDYGFERVFSRQVEALAKDGDVVIAMSTSGQSSNILKALEVARSRNCITVGLLGKDGGQIAPQANYNLIVPSMETPRIQEGHILIIHILCDLVEKQLTCRENAM